MKTTTSVITSTIIAFLLLYMHPSYGVSRNNPVGDSIARAAAPVQVGHNVRLSFVEVFLISLAFPLNLVSEYSDLLNAQGISHLRDFLSVEENDLTEIILNPVDCARIWEGIQNIQLRFTQLLQSM